MKRCSKCGTEKPVTEFYKDSSKKDGLRHWCKRCGKISDANYYRRHAINKTECTTKLLKQQRDELLAVLQFILRGMDGGHIKCAPYFDFDPDAENIELKHPADMIRAAIAKAEA